jgi:hypothetical protein
VRPSPLVAKTDGELFIERMSSGAHTDRVDVDLLLDTNVMLDASSLADVFKSAEVPFFKSGDAWQSRQFQYRRQRARHATVLLWVMAERGLVGGLLGREYFDMLAKLSPRPQPGKDATLYVFTVGWVNVVKEMLDRRGLLIGALHDVQHHARGGKADAELLAQAQKEGLPLITNEGHTVDGYADVKGSGERNLRGLCRDAGVSVFSPQEYLQHLGVDVALECDRFLKALEHPLMLTYLNSVGKKSYRAMLEDLFPTYRLILLGEHSS